MQHKKFLYISSGFVIFILTLLPIAYIIFAILFYNDLVAPYGDVTLLVVFASCLGPSLYLIFHFAWPYNYEDKYLRILFRISFYWSTIAVVLTCIGPVYCVCFTGPVFIFLLVMYIIKIIKPKYFNKKKSNNSCTNIEE